MRTVLPAILILAVGCKPNFHTVDEACHDTVPGAKRIEAHAAIDFASRTNCYRRVAKLYRGRLDRKVQQGVEDHLDYMITHRVWETGAPWNLQTEGEQGFTGVDVYARMEALDYDFDDPLGWGVWEIAYIGTPYTPDELVDYLVPDPFWRQILLQPSWIDAGYAERVDEVSGLTIGHGTIFYSYPSIEREEFPVVYPKDGQQGVPYAYRSDNPYDSLFPLGEVGFPITVTFSNSLASGFNPAEANPYAVAFESAKLTGKSGPVELELITPPGAAEADLLRYTLVAVPLEPLQPGVEYTFEAEVTWSASQRRKLTSVFRTRETPDFRSSVQEAALTARSAGFTQPLLRHHPPRR